MVFAAVGIAAVFQGTVRGKGMGANGFAGTDTGVRPAVICQRLQAGINPGNVIGAAADGTAVGIFDEIKTG